MTKRPKSILVQIDGEQLVRLAELMPAIASWAADRGATTTTPADVVGLCIDLAHCQIFGRANEILDDQAERDETEGSALFPSPSVH